MIMINTNPSVAALGRRGMTLVELMVAMAIGSIVLAIVMTFTVFGGRSFAALGNYSVLDQQSRLGVDQMTREIRQATALIATNASPKSMVITNVTKGISVTYVWDSATKELTAK